MENEFRSDDKSHLPFDPFKVSNSKYSRYEEEVLIDPFLRPPICLILISTVVLAASIAVFVLVGDVSFFQFLFQLTYSKLPGAILFGITCVLLITGGVWLKLAYRAKQKCKQRAKSKKAENYSNPQLEQVVSSIA